MRPQLLLLALVYIATAFAVPVANGVSIYVMMLLWRRWLKIGDTEEVSVGAETEHAISWRTGKWWQRKGDFPEIFLRVGFGYVHGY